MLHILVHRVSVNSVLIDFWPARTNIQYNDQLISSVNECFLFYSKKTIMFHRSVHLSILKKDKTLLWMCVYICDVKGYVWLVNMNLLHHNAEFSHLCDPNRHSINMLFHPVACHLSWLPPKWPSVLTKYVFKSSPATKLSDIS